MKCRAATSVAVSFALFALAPLPASSDTCTPALLGADRRGPAEALARNGDTIYMGAGAALQILEVSDPAAPVQLSYLNLDSVVLDVATAGGLVAVLSRDELTLVDVGDPESPARLGVLPQTPRDAEELAMVPGVAYLASYDLGLRVVDLSDPSQPQVVLELPGPARDVAVYGTRAYVLRLGQLEVYDISTPTNPVLVHDEDSYGGRVEVAGSGSRLAVVTYCSGHHECSSIRFYDLSNPDLPVFRSQFAFPGEESLLSLALSGGRAYAGMSGGHLQVLDLSDLTDPRPLTDIGMPHASGILAAGTRLFVADRTDGFSIWAVPFASPPNRLGRLRTPAQTTGGYFDRGTAVVIHLGGIRVYDLADPAHPVVAGTHAAEGSDRYSTPLASYRDKGYVLRGDSDYRVMGALDPTSPGVGVLLPAHSSDDIERSGSHLYIPTEPYPDPRILNVYDLADPGQPELISQVPAPDRIADLTANGRALFGLSFLEGEPTLRAWDLTDPTTPDPIGESEMPGIFAVDAHGDLLAGTKDEAFALFDVRQPTLPVALSEVPVGETIASLVLAPGRAIVTTSDY